ncbi:MAG: fused signal recognition particle receptor [Actinomycetota bacterium]|jgi:fused signal recognition particle receptor|nr:fused signal recognition particle receptor [Actinomycetota bacterium]
MPEGILPELLIFVALIAIVGVAFFFLRRPDTKEPPHPTRAPAPTEPEVEDTLVEADAGPLIETPVAPPARPSLRERLTKSRKFLADRLSDAFGGGVEEDTWDDLEAALIQADIGTETATKITTDLKERARERKVTEVDGLRALLADELVSLFASDRDRALTFAPEGTTVWLVVGVNGTGKTTTIGKLAQDLTGRGKTVALAAADTFRAAADEQLGIWADRAGAELVKHQPGADPGAVAFDAFAHARAKGLDVLIVDTAGRLHTKTPLMDELSKVRRVIEREGQVDEALLVIDATAGQNGLVQAREFAQSAGVTGVVLSKLDGSAKGGIALAIENTLDIPIKLIGVGEGVDDLEPFDPKSFVDALLT